MKERPILFSAPMVRAILAGIKTQTRRIVRPQPDDDARITMGEIGTSNGAAYVGNKRSGGIVTRVPNPYGQPGDRLWVRETFSDDWLDKGWPVQYRADGDLEAVMFDAGVTWEPSIFMPRSASRITLEVTGVRVERLQEISEEDAKAEGVDPKPGTYTADFALHGYVAAYADLWDQINGKRAPWASNPWVWIVEFKRVLP